MKVTFCSLNSKYIHSALAPWCLYTSAKKYCCQGISLSVAEATVNEKEEALVEKFLSLKSDVLCFSCYIWNIEKTLSLCKRIKEVDSKITLVLGGPEVSYNPGTVLEDNVFIDVVVSGEGEVSLPELINNLFFGVSDHSISGVSYRSADGLNISDRQSEVPEETQSPYCEEYFRSLNRRIAYIESSRGCPFNCAFCLSGRLGKVRYMELERVKNEMVHLACAGAETVKFVDRTFNCNKKRARDILSFIKEQYGCAIPEGTCYHFEIAADLLDEDLLKIIEKLPSASVQFEVGIQSFNEETLKAINRKTDIVKVTENVKKLLSFRNCHVHIDLIAGLPGENYESFVDGFNKAYELGAHMLQLGFLKVLEGSHIAENREKYPCEYSDKPPYEVISTPYISADELKKLHKAERELERLYNSGRFMRTLRYIFEVSGISPYELFLSFGEHLERAGEGVSIPLDRYTNLAFEWFSSLSGIDKTTLRNRMIYDRIATNNSGVIPQALKVVDGDMKKLRNFIKEKDPLQKGINRTVAILYGEGKAIYCDYALRDSITGNYEVKEVALP